ncbi:MAG: VOC family protein [Pseudomonadota bacterium]
MSNEKNVDAPLYTITPYFTVDDADRLIDFLIAVFDATLIKENRYTDGKVQHVRLLIGNSVVMLNSSTDAYSATVSQMHIHVGDVDQTYETALKLGARSLMEPNVRPHGDRMSGIKDPCGNLWWIASKLS